MYNSPTRVGREHSDPYSPVIAEDLLSGYNDWRNVQDIVRLTFKSLTDIIRTQGSSIRELERQMTSRLNRHEIQNLLASKADSRYVSDQLQELRQLTDVRSQLNEIQAEIDDKISRSEMQYLLSQKPSIEETRTGLEQKASVREMDNAVRDVYEHINRLEQNLLSRSTGLERLLEEAQGDLRTKASYEELDIANARIEDKLKTFSIKQVSKSEFESICSRKADLADIQRIMAALETKAEIAWVEQLGYALDQKAAKIELDDLATEIRSKADRRDLDNTNSRSQDAVKDLEYQLQDNYVKLAGFLDKVQEDLDHFKASSINLLSKKAESRDLEQTVLALNKKADNDRISAVIDSLRKDSNDSFQNIRGEIQSERKISDDRLKAFQEAAQKENSVLSDRLQQLNVIQKSSNNDQKQEIEDLSQYCQQIAQQLRYDLSNNISSLNQQLEKAFKSVDELHQIKMDRQEANDRLQRLSGRIDLKAESSEVARIPNFIEDSLQDMSVELRDFVSGKVIQLEGDIFALLDKKVNQNEFFAYLSEKVDASYFNKLLAQKATQEDIQLISLEVNKLSDEIATKVGKLEFQTHVNSTKSYFDDFSKESMSKVNISDINRLLEGKANFDDINSALSRIHSELDSKAPVEDFNSHIQEESVVIEALCSENTTARWLWKSGDLSAGNCVPWEIQSINTCPDNFVWERNATGILIVAPGLYEVAFGFYSRKKPTIQLMINGESVLSAVDNASYIVHHGYGRNAAGNVTGLTLIDFIALPPRARVSLCFTGDATGEGFFGLRKL